MLKKQTKDVNPPIDTSDLRQRQRLMEAAEGRLTKFDNEIAAGHRILRKFPKTVTIFGSARFKPSHYYYKKAQRLSKELAERGFTIVTGGGGGIMQAGNHGASDAGKATVGLNIRLPYEQILNRYVTHHASFHYFFTRKVMLTFFADAYLFFPGGFGTFDELFEVLTLIQTKKMPRVPVILVDKKYWKPLDRFIKRHMLDSRTISPGDEKLYQITQDIHEAIELIDRQLD